MILISPFTISFQLTTDRIVIRINEQTHFACNHNTHSLNIQKYEYSWIRFSIYDKNVEFRRKILSACWWNKVNKLLRATNCLFTQYHVVMSRDDAICISASGNYIRDREIQILRNARETLFYYLLINIVDIRNINKCIRNIILRFLFLLQILLVSWYSSDTKLYTAYL